MSDGVLIAEVLRPGEYIKFKVGPITISDIPSDNDGVIVDDDIVDDIDDEDLIAEEEFEDELEEVEHDKNTKKE